VPIRSLPPRHVPRSFRLHMSSLGLRPFHQLTMTARAQSTKSACGSPRAQGVDLMVRIVAEFSAAVTPDMFLQIGIYPADELDVTPKLSALAATRYQFAAHDRRMLEAGKWT